MMARNLWLLAHPAAMVAVVASTPDEENEKFESPGHICSGFDDTDERGCFENFEECEANRRDVIQDARGWYFPGSGTTRSIEDQYDKLCLTGNYCRENWVVGVYIAPLDLQSNTEFCNLPGRQGLPFKKRDDEDGDAQAQPVLVRFDTAANANQFYSSFFAIPGHRRVLFPPACSRRVGDKVMDQKSLGIWTITEVHPLSLSEISGGAKAAGKYNLERTSTSQSAPFIERKDGVPERDLLRLLDVKLVDAVQTGNAEKAYRALVDGADVNLRDSETTLLHLAAKSGCIDLVATLVSYNANIRAQDASGRLASGSAGNEIVGCLLRTLEAKFSVYLKKEGHPEVKNELVRALCPTPSQKFLKSAARRNRLDDVEAWLAFRPEDAKDIVDEIRKEYKDQKNLWGHSDLGEVLDTLSFFAALDTNHP